VFVRAPADIFRVCLPCVADLGSGDAVPVPSVTEQIMLLVKKYAEYKVENPNPPPSEDKKDERRTDDILPWDKDFMAELEQSTLFDLIMVRKGAWLRCRRRKFEADFRCSFLLISDSSCS